MVPSGRGRARGRRRCHVRRAPLSRRRARRRRPCGSPGRSRRARRRGTPRSDGRRPTRASLRSARPRGLDARPAVHSGVCQHLPVDLERGEVVLARLDRTNFDAVGGGRRRGGRHTGQHRLFVVDDDSEAQQLGEDAVGVAESPTHHVSSRSPRRPRLRSASTRPPRRRPRGARGVTVAPRSRRYRRIRPLDRLERRSRLEASGSSCPRRARPVSVPCLDATCANMTVYAADAHPEEVTDDRCDRRPAAAKPITTGSQARAARAARSLRPGLQPGHRRTDRRRRSRDRPGSRRRRPVRQSGVPGGRRALSLAKRAELFFAIRELFHERREEIAKSSDRRARQGLLGCARRGRRAASR